MIHIDTLNVKVPKSQPEERHVKWALREMSALGDAAGP